MNDGAIYWNNIYFNRIICVNSGGRTMKYIKYGHGKWYTYHELLGHALSLISSDVKDSPGVYTKQETKGMLDIFSK